MREAEMALESCVSCLSFVFVTFASNPTPPPQPLVRPGRHAESNHISSALPPFHSLPLLRFNFRPPVPLPTRRRRRVSLTGAHQLTPGRFFNRRTTSTQMLIYTSCPTAIRGETPFEGRRHSRGDDIRGETIELKVEKRSVAGQRH